MVKMLYGRPGLYLAFCCVLVAAPCCAAEAQPAGGSIVWVKDFAAATKQAKAENKIIMVDCWTDWCKWCKVLDTTTFRDESVVRESRRLVNVKVNGDQSREFVSKYRVTGYPAILFLDRDGREVYRVMGMQSPELFAPIMNDVAAGRNPDKVIAGLIASPPDDAPSLWRLVYHFFQTGQQTAVITPLEKLWRLPADQVADRNNVAGSLGVIYLQSGRMDKLETLLADIDKLDDKNMKETAIRMKLSRATQVRGDYEEALALTDELIAITEDEQERQQLKSMKERLSQHLSQTGRNSAQ
jgi:thioredoxin-like negative regulator of GroEL